MCITVGMEASFPKLAMAVFVLVSSLDFPLALVDLGIGNVAQMFHLLALVPFGGTLRSFVMCLQDSLVALAMIRI